MPDKVDSFGTSYSLNKVKERILELYNEGLSYQQIIERGFNKEQVLDLLR